MAAPSASRLAACWAAVLGSALLAASCRAEEMLFRHRGAGAACSLVALDERTITVAREKGRDVRLPLSETYRWGEPARRSRRPTVLLANGTRLVAAPTWTLEGSVQLDAERLLLRQAMLDDAAIPRPLVHAILFQAAADPLLFQEAAREAATGADDQADRVWLDNGDQFRGRVAEIKAGRLRIAVEEQTLEFELPRVVAVRFAGGGPPPPAPKIAVGLRDGGVVYADSATLAGGARLRVRVAPSLSLAGSRPDAVTLVQPLVGGVVYLSDLTPIDYRHTPYFGVPWGYGGDENLFGQPLAAGQKRWLRGLAMHSASRLVYRLPPGVRTFSAGAAIDSSAARPDSRRGSVVFRVLVARRGGFEPVFASSVVRAGDTPLPIAVDVAGARAIALVVEHADGGETLDHADWLGARLVP